MLCSAIKIHQDDWMGATETEKANILTEFAEVVLMKPHEEYQGEHPTYVIGRALVDAIKNKNVKDLKEFLDFVSARALNLVTKFQQARTEGMALIPSCEQS
jgi:hypothetical protein